MRSVLPEQLMTDGAQIANELPACRKMLNAAFSNLSLIAVGAIHRPSDEVLRYRTWRYRTW